MLVVLATLMGVGVGPSLAEDTLSGAFRQRIAATGKRGFLYLVTSANADVENAASTRLYLYGTVHVGKPSLFPLNDEVAKCLDGSTRLALEADPGKESSIARLVQQLAIYPENDSLSNHIPADLLARLPEVGDRLHIPMARMLRMRAWMLSQSLDMLELAREGLSGGEGVDVLLAQYATQRNIPIVEIEGFERQLQLLSGEPDPVQIDELRDSIDEIQDGQAAHDAQTLLDGWANADVDAVESNLAELRERDSAFSRYLLDEILNARNRTMADRAEQFLAEGGTTFFAVGSLHLFSEQGLVSELKRRGYRVQNLQ
jgi:uncharacterized protein YbaP (TraB family)